MTWQDRDKAGTEEVQEFREILRDIPTAAKLDIIRGMTMFEAGYKMGCLHAIPRHAQAEVSLLR